MTKSRTYGVVALSRFGPICVLNTFVSEARFGNGSNFPSVSVSTQWPYYMKYILQWLLWIRCWQNFKQKQCDWWVNILSDFDVELCGTEDWYARPHPFIRLAVTLANFNQSESLLLTALSYGETCQEVSNYLNGRENTFFLPKILQNVFLGCGIRRLGNWYKLVVPCGRRDGRTDMTKLIVAFRKFENAPKIACTLRVYLCFSSDSHLKQRLFL